MAKGKRARRGRSSALIDHPPVGVWQPHLLRGDDDDLAAALCHVDQIHADAVESYASSGQRGQAMLTDLQALGALLPLIEVVRDRGSLDSAIRLALEAGIRTERIMREFSRVGWAERAAAAAGRQRAADAVVRYYIAHPDACRLGGYESVGKELHLAPRKVQNAYLRSAAGQIARTLATAGISGAVLWELVGHPRLTPTLAEWAVAAAGRHGPDQIIALLRGKVAELAAADARRAEAAKRAAAADRGTEG